MFYLSLKRECLSPAFLAFALYFFRTFNAASLAFFAAPGPAFRICGPSAALASFWYALNMALSLLDLLDLLDFAVAIEVFLKFKGISPCERINKGVM